MTDKKTTLTLNEQYSYMSMWSLMAAPLFLSGNMAKLDAFVRLRGSTFAC